MNLNIADYLTAPRPPWVEVRDLAETLLREHGDDKGGDFDDLYASVRSAVRGLDYTCLARCMDGFEIPDLPTQRAVYRWCQQQIGIQSEVQQSSYRL